jgi:hypothetical protein
MKQTYSNVPSEPSSNDTVNEFDNFLSSNTELSPAVYSSMIGFFVNRGFSEVSSETITTTLMTQAQQDNFNPMAILDTLRGLQSVELSSIVSEILNYNRYKSSSLGYSQKFSPNQEVSRNIIA